MDTEIVIMDVNKSRTCVKFKETLKQTGNKNDRDNQFKYMVLIARFSELNSK